MIVNWHYEFYLVSYQEKKAIRLFFWYLIDESVYIFGQIIMPLFGFVSGMGPENFKL